MWNLGNEHGQYIISVTFIASTTKKTELVSSDTKDVHFRTKAVWKALLPVTAVSSTDRTKCRLTCLPAGTSQGLICWILEKFHDFLYFPVWSRFFFSAESVLSSNDFWVLYQKEKNFQFCEIIEQRPPSEHWFPPCTRPGSAAGWAEPARLLCRRFSLSLQSGSRDWEE